MGVFPQARLERLDVEQRLERKLAHEDFRSRAEEFARLVGVGMAWREAADTSGTKVRAARRLLGMPAMMQRLREGKASPVAAPVTAVSVAEIGPSYELGEAAPVSGLERTRGEPAREYEMPAGRVWPDRPIPVDRRTDQPSEPPGGFVSKIDRSVSRAWSISGPIPGALVERSSQTRERYSIRRRG